jgi:hypothetical protein
VRQSAGRHYQLKVLLSDAERSVLFRLADSVGLTASDYIRTLLSATGDKMGFTVNRKGAGAARPRPSPAAPGPSRRLRREKV